MDGVDVKEISRLSLPTVQLENCISWSEDHKLSYITSTALHIVELSPNPAEASSEMCLERTSMKPSHDTPTSHAGIRVNELFWLLGRRNAYRLVLDTKLAPQLDDTKPLETHFIAAQWSPARMYQDHRCMLATLTDLGSLKLNVPYFKTWVEIVDISRLWIQHCTSLWSKSVIGYNHHEADVNFSVLEERTSQLKITAVAWSKLIENPGNGRCSLLASIAHSGLVGVWKIDHLPDLGTPLKEYKPSLLSSYDTGLYNASSLHWFSWNEDQLALVMGDPNGCVKMLTLNYKVSDHKITNHSLKEIWSEKDRMKVLLINSLPSPSVIGKKRRIIAVTKCSIFLVFLVSQDEVISSCFHRTSGLSITGLETLNDNSFIICNFSGNIFKCSVSINETDVNSLSLICDTLTSNTSWNDLACFGITCSHNKHLWAFGTNLCKMYDHLVIRRPSKIIFTTLRGAEDPLEKLINAQNCIQPFTRLYANWESIELMRINQIKLQKSQGSKIPEYVQEVDKLSLAQLQLELWRSRIFVTHLLTTDVLLQNPEACAYITLLEEIILCRHACEFIDKLLKSRPTSSIDDDNLQSAFLLRLWLQIWLSHNKSANGNKNTSEVPPDTSHHMETDEEAGNIPDPQVSGVAPEALESAVDDTVSVGSFDDAMSTDSNSSYSVSGSKLRKKLPSNFLKLNIDTTHKMVTNTLSLSLELENIGKEMCVFCEQEIVMDIDFRFGTCPANHRLPRCCLCLRQCVEMPYRLCSVCHVVACRKHACDMGTFCLFCDSPLMIDEKLKKEGGQLVPEEIKIQSLPKATKEPKEKPPQKRKSVKAVEKGRSSKVAR